MRAPATDLTPAAASTDNGAARQSNLRWRRAPFEADEQAARIRVDLDELRSRTAEMEVETQDTAALPWARRVSSGALRAIFCW